LEGTYHKILQGKDGIRLKQKINTRTWKPLNNFNETEPGELAKKLYDYLTGIQYGKIEDKYGWITYVD